MAKESITIRTDKTTGKQLSALAEATDRSRNWIVEEALKQYLATNTWQIEGIKLAQASLAEGKRVGFDQAMSNLQAKINRKLRGGKKKR